MDPITEFNLSVNEEKMVALESRGSMGLQLLFKIENPEVIKVERIDEDSKMQAQNIGAPILVTFKIVGLCKGESKLTFYDTRPWDKEFKGITRKELLIRIK